MFRRIGGAIAAILNEWTQFYEEIFTWEDPKAALQNQLRSMYGRGEISSARFLELRARLDRNQIGLDDIQMVRQAGGPVDAACFDREIERSLNRLYIDRGLVAEAQAQIRQSLAALAGEARFVRVQIDAAYRDAQAALPDEDRARAHLERWQRLSRAALDLDTRRMAIEQEQQRLGDLEAELRAAITGLKLLDTQERLAGLNLQVRQDVVVLAQKR
jgi:hypothetical protein